MKNDSYKDLFDSVKEETENPSVDFTANVMAEVTAIASTEKVIEPLIPAKVFWFIAALIFSIGLLPFFIEIQEAAPSYFKNLNLDFVDDELVRENVLLIFHLVFAVGLVFLSDLLMKYSHLFLGLRKS